MHRTFIYTGLFLICLTAVMGLVRLQRSPRGTQADVISQLNNQVQSTTTQAQATPSPTPAASASPTPEIRYTPSPTSTPRYSPTPSMSPTSTPPVINTSNNANANMSGNSNMGSGNMNTVGHRRGRRRSGDGSSNANTGGGNMNVEPTREEVDKNKELYSEEAKRAGRKVGPGSDDLWLWVSARHVLAADKELRDSKINVDVENGVITLTGTVASPDQLKKAGWLANSIKGVIEIRNLLKVSPGIENPGSPLKRKISLNSGSPLFDITELLMPTTVEANSAPAEKSVIEWEWPKYWEVKRSNTIRVSIIRTADQNYVSIAQGEDLQAQSTTAPIPIGTPNVPIEAAFGPDYEASAAANLDAAGFTVKGPTGSDYRSLGPRQVDWEWNILPENEGDQVVTLSILVQWKRKGSNETIQSQIWRKRIQTNVSNPIFRTGTLDASMILGGISGSTLFAVGAFFYKRIRPQKEKPADESSEA